MIGETMTCETCKSMPNPNDMISRKILGKLKHFCGKACLFHFLKTNRDRLLKELENVEGVLNEEIVQIRAGRNEFTEREKQKRLNWLSNIFNVMFEDLTMKDNGDVWVKDFFRLGYFSDDTFWRENPTARALRTHKVEVKEGGVGFKEEPQYDMRIYFKDDGRIILISDNRTQLEVEAWKRNTLRSKEGRRCPECKSGECIELQGSGPDPNTGNIELAFQCATCGHEWTEITP